MLSPCSLLISKNLHAFKHMVVTQDAFQAVYFSFIKLFLLSPSYKKAKRKKNKTYFAWNFELYISPLCTYVQRNFIFIHSKLVNILIFNLAL